MKLRIICLFLLMSCFCSFGQRFRAGVGGGLSVTEIAGMITNAREFRNIGLTGGLLANTQLNANNLFQLEINYIQKGSLQPPDSLNNGYYRFSLYYMEIPVLIRHRFHFTMFKKPVDNVDLEYGFSVGRLIGLEQVRDNYQQRVSPDDVNNTEVSLLIGIDYNFSSNFYFSLRYSNSIIPAIKQNSVSSSFLIYTFNQGNNMVFHFALKYVFGKGKNTVPATPESPAG